MSKMSNLTFDFVSLKHHHDSVNNLLHSPHTKLEIIHNNHERSAHDLSEASLKTADSCAAAKDLLLIARRHLQYLRSAFRRADHGGEHLAPHRLPRKRLKKAILNRLDSLKHAAAPPAATDRSLAAVVDLLEEVRSAISLIVRSLMSMIALPDRGKDPVFRLRLTRVDSLRVWEKCDAAEIRAAAKRMEEVEVVVEEMEAELERMFRRLIRTRASLLNILTN